MNPPLSNLDLDTLKAMYEKGQAELNSSLLSGAAWNDLKEERKKLTEIAILLHKKAQAMGLNPADFIAGDLQRKTDSRKIPDKPTDQLPKNRELPSKNKP